MFYAKIYKNNLKNMENKILKDQINFNNNIPQDIPEKKNEQIENPFIKKEEIKPINNALENQKIEEIKNKITEQNDNLNAPNTGTVNTSLFIKSKIEEIIFEDGVKEIYGGLPQKRKEKFEKDMAKTSNKILQLLLDTKKGIMQVINKIFLLIKKLVNTIGIKDYGYLEKTIKNKVEDIIKFKQEGEKK